MLKVISEFCLKYEVRTGSVGILVHQEEETMAKTGISWRGYYFVLCNKQINVNSIKNQKQIKFLRPMGNKIKQHVK